MRPLSSTTCRLAFLAATTCLAAPSLAAAPAAKSVPIATLVKQVSIPHRMFQLKNGLTVIVHEDHKAPFHTRRLLLFQGCSTQKWFSPIDRKTESRLDRRVVRRDIGAPCAIAFLQPQRVNGVMSRVG